MAKTMQAPAKPRKLRSSVESARGQFTIRYRTRGDARSLFLVLWLTGWTAGCVMLAHKVITEPSLFFVMFAIPFWSSWFFVAGILLSSFFQREELVVGDETLEYTRSIFFPRNQRAYPIGEVRHFNAYSEIADAESGHRESGIEVHTIGKPIRCLKGLPSDEIDWLVFQLNEALEDVKRSSASANAAQVAEDSAESDDEGGIGTGASSRATKKRSPPSDTTWQSSDDFEEFSFFRRGKFSLSAVWGLLFINLFWNCIVGIFVSALLGLAPIDNMQPQTAEWWFLLVFLIPFEVIGLLMFVGLLAALAEPVHRTRWTFGRHEIQYRNTWFGLGRRSHWTIDKLDRAIIRKDAGEQRRFWNFKQTSEFDETPYRLSLIDSKNNEVCSIEGLTNGEARWMRQMIERKRANWFR